MRAERLRRPGDALLAGVRASFRSRERVEQRQARQVRALLSEPEQGLDDASDRFGGVARRKVRQRAPAGGFDDATTVTVGGMAATVVSWTSGRLNITVPAGVAGQYKVVVANASGSSTGILWRYDAGAITIGTGGIIMGTTSEAVAINQPVGWIGDDVAVADPVKGIPAGGYANAAAAQGAALRVNQTGHATPISGLTPGLVVYLGAGGTYTHTPPSKAAGAIFSQQLGYATETGVAFSAMQPVYL